MFKRLALMTMAATILSATPAYAGQWMQDGNGWWWQNDNGRIIQLLPGPGVMEIMMV